jgi:hypothetical protein
MTIKGVFSMTDNLFRKDERLGILLPKLEKEWEEYNVETRESVLVKWETIRGHIPDRIKDIEQTINKKQAQLEIEENFERTCELNSEIADHASVINDLWLWYRTDQDVSGKPHH